MVGFTDRWGITKLGLQDLRELAIGLLSKSFPAVPQYAYTIHAPIICLGDWLGSFPHLRSVLLVVFGCSCVASAYGVEEVSVEASLSRRDFLLQSPCLSSTEG